MSPETIVYIVIGALAAVCFGLLKLRRPGTIRLEGTSAVIVVVLAAAAGLATLAVLPPPGLVTGRRSRAFTATFASLFVLLDGFLIVDWLRRDNR